MAEELDDLEAIAQEQDAQLEAATDPTPTEEVKSEEKPEAKQEKPEQKRERDDKGRFVAGPQRYQHSPALAQLAYQAGIDQETFELSPPEDLRALISARGTQRQDRPVDEYDIDKFDFGDRKITDYDEGLVKYLRTVGGKLKAIEEENRQLKQFHQQSASRQATQQWDKLFASAPEHLAGKGDMADLAPNSDEAQWRIKIVKLAGNDIGRARELISMLGTNSYPGTIPEKTSKEAERWRQNGLYRPTNREAREPKGTKLAVKNVNRILQERSGKAEVIDDEQDVFE